MAPRSFVPASRVVFFLPENLSLCANKLHFRKFCLHIIHTTAVLIKIITAENCQHCRNLSCLSMFNWRSDVAEMISSPGWDGRGERRPWPCGVPALLRTGQSVTSFSESHYTTTAPPAPARLRLYCLTGEKTSSIYHKGNETGIKRLFIFRFERSNVKIIVQKIHLILKLEFK